MLQTSVSKDFLNLFYHEVKDYHLLKSNKLNVFTLKIRNNAFTYDELIELLSNNLYYFALSRIEYQELISQNKFGTLVRKAKERFRKYTVNEGEIGEVLLYCFLEAHLGAPKILTKLEIKTAPNDYVKGADGVHLLKITESDYQLVLGESKLDSNLRNGIYDAFNSLTKLLEETKLKFEIGLVNSQLIKESFNDTMYKFLKQIIIPSASEEEYFMDYSFGIFLGFNIEITEQEKELENKEFRKVIREKIKKVIFDNIDSINYQIKKSQFSGYNFYIYIIPFSDLQENRKELINRLTQ